MTVRKAWRKRAAKTRKPRGIRSIAFVDMGDWQGLYVNGVLELEDEQISVNEALAVLRIACKMPAVELGEGDVLRKFHGALPKRYKDVPGALEGKPPGK